MLCTAQLSSTSSWDGIWALNQQARACSVCSVSWSSSAWLVSYALLAVHECARRPDLERPCAQWMLRLAKRRCSAASAAAPPALAAAATSSGPAWLLGTAATAELSSQLWLPAAGLAGAPWARSPCCCRWPQSWARCPSTPPADDPSPCRPHHVPLAGWRHYVRDKPLGCSATAGAPHAVRLLEQHTRHPIAKCLCVHHAKVMNASCTPSQMSSCAPAGALAGLGPGEGGGAALVSQQRLVAQQLLPPQLVAHHLQCVLQGSTSCMPCVDGRG